MALPLLTQVEKLYEEYQTTTANPGICIACGYEQYNCEPDAINIPCESCYENLVYGVEFLYHRNMFREETGKTEYWIYHQVRLEEILDRWGDRTLTTIPNHVLDEYVRLKQSYRKHLKKERTK